jgi:hypothetical protein
MPSQAVALAGRRQRSMAAAAGPAARGQTLTTSRKTAAAPLAGDWFVAMTSR